ncbi:MAG: hypothetical protein IT190_03280 [Microbacteriaceae bacterium]|nr:hypothetical protein [Microbacteriaceae bacterium]
MDEIFLNRVEAGRQLATRLAGMRGEDVVVLGLPRGGVPVAAEVAAVLEAPLDVIVVRKLGVPFQPEVAMGAIGEDGVRILDHQLIEYLGITPEQIEKVERTERAILAARIILFRSDIERQDLTGRTALIVDDGIATGSTASVACRVARGLGAARVVVAAPVGGPDSVQRLRDADEVICLIQPDDFAAVGVHYRDFRPTSETEVVQLLSEARRREGEAGR